MARRLVENVSREISRFSVDTYISVIWRNAGFSSGVLFLLSEKVLNILFECHIIFKLLDHDKKTGIFLFGMRFFSGMTSSF